MRNEDAQDVFYQQLPLSYSQTLVLFIKNKNTNLKLRRWMLRDMTPVHYISPSTKHSPDYRLTAEYSLTSKFTNSTRIAQNTHTIQNISKKNITWMPTLWQYTDVGLLRNTVPSHWESYSIAISPITDLQLCRTKLRSHLQLSFTTLKLQNGRSHSIRISHSNNYKFNYVRFTTTKAYG